MNTIVVTPDPISTQNMTGLRAIRRGSSFLKLSPMAGIKIERSVRLLRPLRRWRSWIFSFISLVEVAGSQLKLLEDGSQREGRKEGECADDEDHADEKADEQGPVGGKRAGAGRHHFLSGERTRQGEDGDDLEEAADPHRGSPRGVVVEGVARQARKRASVVCGRRRELIEDLAKTVSARVERAGQTCWRNHGDRSEAEDAGNVDQYGQGRQA